MKAYVLETPIGVLVTDTKGLIIEKFLWETIADDELLCILHYDPKICDNTTFKAFIEQLNSKSIDLVSETQEMKALLGSIFTGSINVSIHDSIFKKLRGKLISLLETNGLIQSRQDLINKSRKNAKLFSRDRIRESGQNSDIHIINAVGVLENTTKFINTYAIQLREWYGSHFPEFTDSLVNDIELYAKIVSLYEKREAIKADSLVKDLNIKEDYAKEIEYQALHSMGGVLTEAQFNAIRLFSKEILNLLEFRNQIEESVDKILKELTPNLQILIGSQLTGKLITHAGGLEQLAKMPSSTIQVLGAEKALFRALRKHTDSPKHGVIYTWPGIRSAKYWQRGKISRLLSGKISICAKVDYFKGKLIADQLIQDLEKKLADIKSRFPDPPKTVKKKKEVDYGSKKKKEIARKKAYHSKSRYKSGVKKQGGRSN